MAGRQLISDPLSAGQKRVPRSSYAQVGVSPQPPSEGGLRDGRGGGGRRRGFGRSEGEGKGEKKKKEKGREEKRELSVLPRPFILFQRAPSSIPNQRRGHPLGPASTRRVFFLALSLFRRPVTRLKTPFMRAARARARRQKVRGARVHAKRRRERESGERKRQRGTGRGTADNESDGARRRRARERINYRVAL